MTTPEPKSECPLCGTLHPLDDFAWEFEEFARTEAAYNRALGLLMAVSAALQTGSASMLQQVGKDIDAFLRSTGEAQP